MRSLFPNSDFPITRLTTSVIDFASSFTGKIALIYYSGTDKSWLPNQDDSYIHGHFVIENTVVAKKITAMSWDGKKMSTKIYGNNQWQRWYDYVHTSDLTPVSTKIAQMTNTDKITIDLWYVYAVKSGYTITMHFNISGRMVGNNDFMTLFTLPKNIRPKEDVIVNYVAQTGELMLLCIRSSGIVEIHNFNTSMNGAFLRQCITYMTY